VYADTAGGLSGVAKDRDVAEAWWLADQLSARARFARGPAPLLTSTVAGPVSDGPVAGPEHDDAPWQRP